MPAGISPALTLCCNFRNSCIALLLTTGKRTTPFRCDLSGLGFLSYHDQAPALPNNARPPSTQAKEYHSCPFAFAFIVSKSLSLLNTTPSRST